MEGRRETSLAEVGFRAFSLTSSALPRWPSGRPPMTEDDLAALLKEQLSCTQDPGDPERLLFEVIPMLGFTLDVRVESIDVGGRPVVQLDHGRALFVPQPSPVTLEFIESLLQRGPERLVLREASFCGDDGLMLAARRRTLEDATTLQTV